MHYCLQRSHLFFQFFDFFSCFQRLWDSQQLVQHHFRFRWKTQIDSQDAHVLSNLIHISLEIIFCQVIKCHLPNAIEETHHRYNGVFFKSAVPRHPQIWHWFIQHDRVDVFVLVECNDIVYLTLQTISDVHFSHQIIQREWPLDEHRKKKTCRQRIDWFSGEHFEPQCFQNGMMQFVNQTWREEFRKWMTA